MKDLENEKGSQDIKGVFDAFQNAWDKVEVLCLGNYIARDKVSQWKKVDDGGIVNDHEETEEEQSTGE